MKYKVSRYNISFSHAGRRYMYNSLSTSIIEIDASLENALLNGDINAVREDYLDELIAQHFIVSDTSDETKEYFDFYDSEKCLAEERFLGITVIPTYSCNLKCTYCLQGQEHKSKIMEQATIDAIKRFVENYIKSHSALEHIGITFYGGEPLLGVDCCRKIIENISESARKNNIAAHFMIVSNMTILTKDTIDLIRDYHIQVQVSIDGPKALHDTKRIFPDGRGTYDLITANMRKLLEANLKNNIVLRVNVDQSNINSLDSLMQEIRKYSDDLYFSLLQKYKGINDNFCENVIQNDDASSANREFGKIYKKYHLPVIRNFGKKSPCAFSAANRLWIDCKNDIYKCELLVNNPDFAVGKLLNDGSIKYSAKYSEYINWHPKLNEKCCSCELLPLCAGGCPARYASEYGNPFQYGNCSQTRETLIEHLKNYLDLCICDNC